MPKQNTQPAAQRVASGLLASRATAPSRRGIKGDMRIRFRIDFDQLCSVGPGKVQLLEQIALSGSLSEAARSMDMSYRRAWLLLNSMNNGFERPVATSSVGGRGGGGVALTAFGYELVSAYRALETELKAICQRRMRHIQRTARA